MTFRKLIYIAGPFRAKTPWLVEQNIRQAETWSLEVDKLPGLFAICPHTMTRFFDKALPDEVFLEGTEELLRRCDGILMTGPWHKSSGSISEMEEAERLGIPVFKNLEELSQYPWPDQYPTAVFYAKDVSGCDAN